MATTIPLPAMHIQPVQIPDMIGDYERVLRIKQAIASAPLQQQALQQQVQQGGLNIQKTQMENQAAQQAQQDQQVFHTTMMDPSMQGRTIGEVADTLAQQGKISQTGWMNLKKEDMEQKDHLAAYTEKQLANTAAAHQQMQTLYNNVMNLPDDVLAQQWPSIVQQYQSIPGTKLALDPNQPLTKQQLQHLGPLISMQESYLANETAKREAAAKAKTAENAAMYPTGDVAEAKYRDILQRKAAGQPLSADDVNYARGYEASNAKNTTTSDSLGVSGVSTSRPAGLAAAGGAAAPSLAPAGGGAPSPQGVPSAKDSIVDLIGQYRYDPAQLTRLVGKHPDILSLVQQKYPGFDETTYQAKNKVMQNYTSGPQSREINAYNTTMGHLGVLDAAVSALNNNDVRALNAIGNAIGAGTGNDAATVFKAIVHRVGPEITSAYITGGGGEAERIANENDFNENMAPQQLRTNIRTSAKLLDSKVEALEQQYANTVGRDDFSQRFITPVAKAARDKLIGGNSGGASSYKATATGAGGHKIGSNDGGNTWYDVQTGRQVQ